MAAREEWSRGEVELLVADYFSMLTAELAGQPYSKTEHRNQFLPLLPNRNGSSVEFKHCYVSAVLIALSQPYIRGNGGRTGEQYDFSKFTRVLIS